MEFYDGRVARGGGPFKKTIVEFDDLLVALSNQIESLHHLTLNTLVLHDGPSQDWTETRAASEGGRRRISAAVQFWAFHVRGLRADLYNWLPPGVAQPMLGRLFNDSLAVLTVRYCQVK